MFRSSLIVAGAALLCSTAAAQHSLDAARKMPITVPIKDAGTVDVTTGKWTPANTASKKAVQTIFNNTCTWSIAGYYSGLGECEDSYDEGQVPSTGNPFFLGSGANDSQEVTSVQIAYCTYNVTTVSGADITLAFWDKLNGDCVGGIPPTPPSWATSPLVTAYLPLAGLGLPGSTANGSQACWTVTLDTANTGFTLASDGEGTFDNLGSEDKFIWGKRFNDVTPVIGSANGFIISGDPGYAIPGSCSYNIPCATDALYGNPCGTGFGADDGEWINVDGVGVNSSAGTPAGCTSSVAVYGYGTNCYFFNGYPTNPFASYWLVLEGEGGTGGTTPFCNSRPSSLPGCTPTLTAGGNQVSKTAPGTPLSVTAAPVPGGGGKPGILIYTKNGVTANPINTPFGELCLMSFLRAGAFPAVPGGTSGVCDGTYSWDFQAIALFYGQIAAGDSIDIQAWYRDPQNPGTANFTNGTGSISVVP